MKGSHRLYKWYIISALIFSSFEIVSGILMILGIISERTMSNIFLKPIYIYLFGWFFLNIFMFFWFAIKNVDSIGMILSSLYVFDRIFSTLLGLTYYIMKIDPLKTFWGNVLGLAVPVITFVIAYRLLQKHTRKEKKTPEV